MIAETELLVLVSLVGLVILALLFVWLFNPQRRRLKILCEKYGICLTEKNQKRGGSVERDKT